MEGREGANIFSITGTHSEFQNRAALIIMLSVNKSTVILS